MARATRSLVLVDTDGIETEAGPATDEQIAASDSASGGTGLIRIDEDGDVIPTGATFFAGSRTAWVR